MHVAFVFPSAADGSVRKLAYTMNRYAMALIRELLKCDPCVRATILTTRSAGSRNQEVPEAPPYAGQYTVRRCFSWNAAGLLSLIWRVRWSEFDMVHLQHETFVYGGPLSLLLFPFVVRWIRRHSPAVVTLHHVIHPDNINKQFTEIYNTRLPAWAIRWGYGVFYRLVGWAASQCVVHEAYDKAILFRAYGIADGKITVIHHGAEEAMHLPAANRQKLIVRFGLPHDADRIFGFFGYLDNSKGIDFLIDEFLEHLTAYPQDVLIIAGTLNPHYVKQKTLRKKFQLLQRRAECEGHGKIRWYGELPAEYVDTFYQLIDALVIPYRSFNGGSAALARAISYNVPCLLSEAFAKCDTGPAIVFPFRKGGLCEQLRTCHVTPRLPRPADPAFHAWRKARLWPDVSAETNRMYQQLISAYVQRPSILLLGAYGQRNLGDELLLAQCLQMLPRARCAVASADPERTQQEHNVAALPRSGSPWRLLRALLHARVIVVGGGDQFKLMKPAMRRSRYSLLMLDALLASLCRMLRKKLFYIGVGIGNIGTPLARLLTRWTLKRTHAVTFRETESFHIAKQLAPSAPINQGTDLAFLSHLDTRIAPRNGTIAHLGIAPCVHMDHADAYGHIVRELARGAETFLAHEDGRQVTFLPFQTGFAPHHDILVSREIRDKMPGDQRCVIAEDLDLATVHPLYASLDMLWGMRLHSIILACLHAVPFIALLYDVKVKNFLREIGCEQWGIPLDASFSAEKLLSLHNALASQLPEVRSHLQKQTKKLSELAQINAQLMQTIGNEPVGIIIHQPSPAAKDHANTLHLAPEA